MARALAGWTVVLSVALFAGDAPPAGEQSAERERLAKVQQLVGAWKGVGQPQRASTKDSWLEEADWAWSFGKEGPALVAKLPKTKYFSQLRLSAGKQAGEFTLAATPAAGG